MRKVLAIVTLSWKAAIRYKFLWVLVALLVLTVGVLPLQLETSEDPRDLIRIILTYTLFFILAILGAATLWLACGTLACCTPTCGTLACGTVRPMTGAR